jgi:hypothetical protein
MKLPPLKTTIDIVGNGPLSVDMFFTLSGFLIGGILLQLKEAPDFYKTFYKGESQEKHFPGDWKERLASLHCPAHVNLRGSWDFLFKGTHVFLW